MSQKEIALLSVVVPCYNEQEALDSFYSEISRVCKSLNNIEYELVFIDDGSRDETLSKIQGLADSDSHISYLAFSRNFGKEAATYAGLECAKGDYVITMDADLQDPPRLIPEMFRMLSNPDIDCVATRRINRKGEPPIRSFFARTFYKLISKFGSVEIVDGSRDFRLMTRRFVDSVLRLKEHNRFSRGLFAWVGYKTEWIEFENQERLQGETKWTFFSLFSYAIEGIIAFSTVPLRLSVFIGMASFVASILAVLFLTVRYFLFGDPVSGWVSTVCIILLIGGVQLFCIGILGEYLGKLFIEAKQRPHYIIKETNLSGNGNPRD